MRAELYWIPGPWAGRLAIAPRPRGGDWLADELAGWKRAGVGCVLSRLTSGEAAELDLADVPTLCMSLGIEFVSLPIEDRGLPPAEVVAVVSNVFDRLLAGTKVHVHCRQGIGRAGMVAAAVLTRAGVGPARAIQIVSDARGRPVPETDAQREWVIAFCR